MIITKLKRIVELQDSIELDNLDYKKYIFSKVSLPAVFLRDIHTNDFSIENADEEQSDLFRILKSLNKGKKSPEKVSFLKKLGILLEARQDVLNNFKSNIFPINCHTIPRESLMGETSSQQDKVLTTKQMLQILPIALAQIKVCNNSENLLKEIRHIVYSLYQSKEITKKSI